MDWLRPPPLTEPDGSAGLSIADGEDDGNSRFSLTVGPSIIAFSSEPVKGKHLAVWLGYYASGSESENSSRI